MDSNHDKQALNVCGPQVRRLRSRHQWSQPKLAEKCQLAGWDISRDIIARIECQNRRVGDFELANLAEVLGGHCSGATSVARLRQEERAEGVV